MSTINIGGKEYTAEEIEAFKMLLGQKHDVSTTTEGMQVPHGTQPASLGGAGLFSRPGGSPDVYSTIGTYDSLANALYRGVTRITNPEYSILSGIGPVSGETTDSCGPAGKVGVLKLCTTRNTMGEFRVETDVVNLAHTGERLNYSDTDVNIVNPPAYTGGLIPSMFGVVNNINSVTGAAFMTLAATVMEEMSKVLYTGLAGTQSGLWKSEFSGFDQLIKTGHVDLETGLACTAADSIIVNRAGVDVTDTTNNIVTQIGGIYRRLQNRAAQQRLNPVVLELAMNPNLFEALTRVWPQSYYTEGAVGYTTSTIGMSNTREMTEERYAMRNGSYLMIGGERVFVHQEYAIPLTDSGNAFASDIYFVPRFVRGGRVASELLGFDMNNVDIRELLGSAMAEGVKPANNGLYMLYNARTATCVSLGLVSRPTLRLYTPWLAARLTNVGFVLGDGYFDDPVDPTSAYYVNGGRYSSVAPYTA